MHGSVVHSVQRSLNTVECSHEVQLAFGGHVLVVMGVQELKAS